MSVVCDHGASLRLLVHFGKKLFVIIGISLKRESHLHADESKRTLFATYDSTIYCMATASI
jgi:hypothetical protein